MLDWMLSRSGRCQRLNTLGVNPMDIAAWQATRDHCVTLRYTGDVIAAEKTGAVPEKLSYGQVRPLLEWAWEQAEADADIPAIAIKHLDERQKAENGRRNRDISPYSCPFLF